jgi:hypothetical protein
LLEEEDVTPQPQQLSEDERFLVEAVNRKMDQDFEQQWYPSTTMKVHQPSSVPMQDTFNLLHGQLFSHEQLSPE